MIDLFYRPVTLGKIPSQSVCHVKLAGKSDANITSPLFTAGGNSHSKPPPALPVYLPPQPPRSRFITKQRPQLLHRHRRRGIYDSHGARGMAGGAQSWVGSVAKVWLACSPASMPGA